jgi:hypothetical protein
MRSKYLQFVQNDPHHCEKNSLYTATDALLTLETEVVKQEEPQSKPRERTPRSIIIESHPHPKNTMNTLPITLPENLTTFLQTQIESGHYAISSDYIQALIQAVGEAST